MKILIVADTYYPHVNGASYFAQRLAFYMQQAGHQVLVIAPSMDLSSDFFENDGIKIFGVRSFPVLVAKNFRFSLPILTRRKIKKVIRDFKPDVVHINSHFFVCRAVAGMSKKMGIPVVGTNHFMPENLVHFMHLPKKAEEKIKKMAWKQFRTVFEKLDYVTTPTQAAAKLLIDNGFTKKVVPVSNGIDLEKFHSGKDSDYLYEKFNLPRKPILLFVGRLDKEKKVDFIIKHLPDILKKVDLHFVVAGNGKEKENLEKMAKRLDLDKNVTFTGYVLDHDKENLYNLTHCFIIACEVELQSLVTMEAMATGAPVIGVDALALPELIHDGENGYLFQPKDSQAMVEAVVKIFSDKNLHDRMSAKSLEIIRNHGIDVTIKKFEDIYRLVIDNKRK